MSTKIVHVIESGDLSGSGRMVANICNRLDPARFDTTLVYSVRPHATPEMFGSMFNSNVQKVYLPEMVRQLSLRKDVLALLKLRKLFITLRPDIVHGHSSKAGFLSRFAALFASVPKIFYSSHGYSFRMIDSSILMRAVYLLAEAIASPIGHIIVNAPNELKMAKKLAWGKRVYPFYNGIDISGVTPSFTDNSGNPKIIACGRITEARNPSAFIRLCAGLQKKYPDLSCKWVGSGDEEEMNKFKNLLDQFNLGTLEITGWLEYPDVLKEMGNADIFIHYSRWDVMPTVVSEAMALGKPVIGSGAVDQIVHGENGFIAGSEEELFDYTCRLLDSRELINQFGKRARKDAEEHYNLDKLIPQLEKVYLS